MNYETVAAILGFGSITGIFVMWIIVDEKLPFRMYKKFSNKF
jgi:hypothetical protein